MIKICVKILKQQIFKDAGSTRWDVLNEAICLLDPPSTAKRVDKARVMIFIRHQAMDVTQVIEQPKTFIYHACMAARVHQGGDGDRVWLDP
jgi:hypothetical protein